MVTQSVWLPPGENYVYVNREARMGRTALVIHPTLKERSSTLAEPASDIKTCDHYQQFPLYLAGERHEHYGIPHGFSSRVALERYLNGLFGEASKDATAMPVAKKKAQALPAGNG